MVNTPKENDGKSKAILFLMYHKESFGRQTKEFPKVTAGEIKWLEK